MPQAGEELMSADWLRESLCGQGAVLSPQVFRSLDVGVQFSPSKTVCHLVPSSARTSPRLHYHPQYCLDSPHSTQCSKLNPTQHFPYTRNR